ncbi:MAG: PspC domain-containing protein [Cyclobacteriaceae bacterium]|nr:PspC domain-containing protein [Cyclobacteriaceae bacterium]
MKKNISINISGIIFHIEEDAYEILKKYLDSVHKYFASYDDSTEIIADIESRIAEIFLSKLHEQKQVITLDDVKALITTMGSVHDFQAAEADYSEEKDEPSASSTTFTAPQPRRLYRDQKRKVLGGVCAGIGYYFGVDPVWIRLLFVLLTFAWGIILLAYIILWIAVPGSYELEEPHLGKKLFRDAEKKVVGGVAAGLAAYFNTDVVLFRVLFVVFTFFGGLGLIAYLVLWIVVPQARTLTDRMQMQGEPVTLSNIKSTLKKSPAGREEESTLTRILLFPFRLIGWIITGLGKILSPLADVIRVAAGIVMMVTGLALLIALITSFGILMGMFTLHISWIPGWEDVSFPVQELSRAIPSFTVIAAFIFLLIPGVLILLLGISIVAGRVVFNALTGWSLFIAFLLSAVVLGFSIPKIVLGFREEGEIKEEVVYRFNGKTPVLRTRETGLDDYHVTTLALRGYEDKEFKLVQFFRAQGKSKKEAEDYARQVTYAVEQNDSILTFDSNIQFKHDAVFRAQRLRMILYVPYNHPFVLDDDMWRLVSNYIPSEYRNGQTWTITEENRLKCITCPEQVQDEVNWDEEWRPDTSLHNSSEKIVPHDFDEVQLSGVYDVTITRGDTYAIEFTGSNEERDRYHVGQDGRRLIIDYRNHFSWKDKFLTNEKIRIRITMPELQRIEASGAGEIKFSGFTEDELEIEVAGAVKLRGDVNVRNLNIELTGASKLDLRGEGRTLEAELLGASHLDAYDFQVHDARVKAAGASHARVYVSNSLEMEESVASSIRYRGNPRKVIKE